MAGDDEVRIRPMVPPDVDAASATVSAATASWPGEPAGAAEAGVRLARVRGLVAHLLGTDPDGAWVAEAAGGGGAIAGVAMAIVRDGLWGLSLLGVQPDAHGRRVGARLMDPALAYGSGVEAGLICCSEHPAAMRLYARAGLRLLPCVSAGGVPDLRGAPAAGRVRDGVRPGDVEAAGDVATCAAASRLVRGASHDADLRSALDAGGELLVLPGRGFVVHREGSPQILAAVDEEAATSLLWATFAAAPRGGTVAVEPIGAGNDWAVAVSLAAGLALSPTGPVFVRGTPGPLAPYLPSGAYL